MGYSNKNGVPGSVVVILWTRSVERQDRFWIFPSQEEADFLEESIRIDEMEVDKTLCKSDIGKMVMNAIGEVPYPVWGMA